MKISTLSVLMSLAICIASAYQIPLAIQTAQHAMVVGLFFVYMLATNSALLFAIFRIRSRNDRYVGTLTVLATVALAVGFMWLILGAYFVSFATHGVSSEQELVLDTYLRRGLALQRIFLPLIALWSTWGRGKIDTAVAAILVAVLALFTISSQSMSF